MFNMQIFKAKLKKAIYQSMLLLVQKAIYYKNKTFLYILAQDNNYINNRHYKINNKFIILIMIMINKKRMNNIYILMSENKLL